MFLCFFRIACYFDIMEVIEEARKNGQWDALKSPIITDEQIAFLSSLLQNH